MAAKSSTTRLAFPCLEVRDVGDARHEVEEMRETRTAEGEAKRRSDRPPAHDIDQVTNATPALAVLARLAGLAAMVDSDVVVLLGWLFGIETLKRVFSGWSDHEADHRRDLYSEWYLLFLWRPRCGSASNADGVRGVLLLVIYGDCRPHLTGFAICRELSHRATSHCPRVGAKRPNRCLS